MINQNKKYQFYLVSHVDNQPHLIFTIKIHKDNIYFINSSFIKNFNTKISYHTPRLPSNKSQVHLKINDIRPQEADLSCPVEEIKGVRYLGGSGCPLDKLSELPLLNDSSKNVQRYIFDSRKIYLGNLSSVQWSWFLLEPDKEDVFYVDPMIKDKQITEATQRMHIQVIKETKPWIIVEFIRIRDEIMGEKIFS